MHRHPLAAGLLLAGLITLPARAQDSPTLDAILVTATRIPTPDVLAPYASEVHTRGAIEQSGAVSLVDYLAQHSSLSVLPSFGSRSAPLLDMRGYGLESGYQNIVVTLDGVRLNAVDMATALLGNIPLSDVERIEIDKGTGSVLFGDNAGAGVIQIRTRARQGVEASAQAGSFGYRGGNLGAGLVGERVSLSASADYAASDGDADRDPSGQRNESASRALRGRLGVNLTPDLKLGLEGASARLDERYVEPLSLAEFRADPHQAGAVYAQVKRDVDNWRATGAWAFHPEWTLSAWHGREDKTVDNVKWSWKTAYDVVSDDLALAYRAGALDLTLGWQRHEGCRDSIGDRTCKKNAGWYAAGQWRVDRTTLAAGLRREQVDYAYRPVAGGALSAEERLRAWELGVNHRVDGRLSLFAHYNQAFQAPDIDRFFAYDFGAGSYTFNGFIEPQTSRTLTLGLNHVTAGNRLKLALFRADLDDEIYYYSTGAWSGYNTNLDKSHKFGLEIQDDWRISPAWSATLNYTFTRAVIDREDAAAGAYDGKDLPGVPRHGVVLGLTWRPDPARSLTLTHTWRDRAWAVGDFDNDNAQRQGSYQSTDLAYRRDGKSWGWFAGVRNLFARRNGVWVGDDAIYPVNVSRFFNLGLSGRF